MKKTYVKPMIVFEDFMVTASIAAGCFNKTNHAEDVCGYTVGDLVIFTDGVTNCQMENGGWSVLDEEASNIYQVCYHVPEGMNLFDS